MDISKCETCAEVCPQAQGRREASVGRMYAMRELAKCAPYWDALFDENEKPKITPDRLRELVEADRDGRCFITLPYGEEERPSANDPVGPEGDPGVPVKIVCEDESGDVTPEKWDWLMNRFLRGEKSGQNL